jgi:hypothetical protein
MEIGMNEPNPIEPPAFDPAESMALREALRDKLIASRMIEIRERGGQSYGQFLRWSVRPYLIGILYLGVALTVLYLMELYPLFYWVLGMFLGMYLRDFGWVRKTRKTWPFTLKVTDWDMVRRIAEQEPSSPGTSAHDASHA